MHNTIAHHPPANAQPDPEQWQAPQPTPPAVITDRMPYGVG